MKNKNVNVYVGSIVLLMIVLVYVWYNPRVVEVEVPVEVPLGGARRGRRPESRA